MMASTRLEVLVGVHPARRWHAAQLADRAVEALIAEALLTPKPALVDGRGSGAHRDLDLHTMLRSARSLRSGFFDMARFAGARCAAGHGVDTILREGLARIGRASEASMLRVTQGANAHRGAIWILGLLVAAKAMSPVNAEATVIAALAARIAVLPDRFAAPAGSHGAQACMRYGVRGARGEAIAGFPHIVEIGLPALRLSRRRGADETRSRLDALMAIMSSLDDTCLLHRGGEVALAAAQRGAREVLDVGGAATAAGWRALLDLDARLTALNASPGGCADLLAGCIFLESDRAGG